MMLIFLLLLPVSASSNCAYVFCPKQDVIISNRIDCAQCTSCIDSGMRFCISARNHSCGCTAAVPETCKRSPDTGLVPISYCNIPDQTPLPSPIVRRQGSSGVSVIVPRFFQKSPFNNYQLNGLMLTAVFHTKENLTCRDQYHIQAQRRSDSECMLRIQLAMPGIDHKTEDNYYYDDQTELESVFSTDMFEEAERVQFAIEVGVIHDEKIANGTLRFHSTKRSPPVVLSLSESNQSSERRNATLFF